MAASIDVGWPSAGTRGAGPPSRRERAALALERTGLGQLLRRAGTWRGLLVLNYHHVADPDAVGDPGVWSATPEALDRQIALARRHCEIVGAEALDSPPSRRGRRMMITFDDGYRSNFAHALPVLAAHGVPALFFLTTGYIDDPRLPWWERLAATVDDPRGRGRTQLELRRRRYQALPADEQEDYLEELEAEAAHAPLPSGGGVSASTLWMTWDMVRGLRDAGMSIGGHTVSHPMLGQLDPARQEAEVAHCLDRIASELGEAVRLFSYPYGVRGSYDHHTRAALRRCGVRFAFSYYGGHNPRRSWDPYDIRRVSVAADMSPERYAGTLAFPQGLAAW